MPEFLRRLLATVQAQWGRLDARQRVVTVAAAAVTILGIVGLVVYQTRPSWTPLGTFDPALSAQIRAELVRRGYVEGRDFRVAGGGRTIEVDRSKRDQAILDMSEAGLTVDAQLKGWNLFDQFDWTMTEREEQVRILRANIDEMRRLIRGYAQIEDVEIVAPFIEKQPLFRDEEITRTVSVRVKLHAGATLAPEQVRALRNTVAAGFPGLKPENVEITDQFMNALDSGDAEGTVGVRQVQVERDTERQLEREIRNVIGRIIGADRVSASVNVEFDWDAVKEAREEYASPGFEQLKVSEENDREALRGAGIVPRGQPGVQSNVPTFQAQEGIGPIEYDRTQARVNYLANKTLTERIQSPYVKRVTAAVAIDGVWREEKDTETGKTRWVYSQRPAEEIKTYEELVHGILGRNPERQDVVVVRQVEYDRTQEFRLREEREAAEFWRRVSQFALLGAIVAVAALFLFYQGWRARLRLKADEIARQRELERQRALAAAEAALAGEITLEEAERQQMIRRASDLARSRPQLVAALIRTWLAEEA